MTIQCPAPGCGHRYEDRDRASLIAALGADTAAVEVNARQESTTRCPKCGQVIDFGLLMLDDDGLWRVSRFAGKAHDVTVMRPPGGGVSYDPPKAEPPTSAIALSPTELKIRDRALAVIEERAPSVAQSARRDAVDLALEVGVLDETEVAWARLWLERRRP